jgi:hypothetical protein
MVLALIVDEVFKLLEVDVLTLEVLAVPVAMMA